MCIRDRPTTTVSPPAPCTTTPGQIEIESDVLLDNKNQETSTEIKIDVRVPPKPLYVC